MHRDSRNNKDNLISKEVNEERCGGVKPVQAKVKAAGRNDNLPLRQIHPQVFALTSQAHRGTASKRAQEQCKTKANTEMEQRTPKLGKGIALARKIRSRTLAAGTGTCLNVCVSQLHPEHGEL